MSLREHVTEAGPAELEAAVQSHVLGEFAHPERERWGH